MWWGTDVSRETVRDAGVRHRPCVKPLPAARVPGALAVPAGAVAPNAPDHAARCHDQSAPRIGVLCPETTCSCGVPLRRSADSSGLAGRDQRDLPAWSAPRSLQASVSRETSMMRPGWRPERDLCGRISRRRPYCQRVEGGQPAAIGVAWWKREEANQIQGRAHSVRSRGEQRGEELSLPVCGARCGGTAARLRTNCCRTRQ